MKKPRLHKELSIAVIIKLVLIYVIYLIFFSHPLQVNQQSISSHLFSSQHQVTDTKH